MNKRRRVGLRRGPIRVRVETGLRQCGLDRVINTLADAMIRIAPLFVIAVLDPAIHLLSPLVGFV